MTMRLWRWLPLALLAAAAAITGAVRARSLAPLAAPSSCGAYELRVDVWLSNGLGFEPGGAAPLAVACS